MSQGLKRSTLLQVSVLTDQVEVQGEKIRDLDRCLAEHREKLNNTEQLFQQVSIPSNVCLLLLFVYYVALYEVTMVCTV